MQEISYLLCFFGAILNVLVFVKSYSLCSGEALIFNRKNIIIFIFITVLDMLANNFINSKYKIIIMFCIVFLLFKLTFNDNFLSTVYKTIILYIILFICDFLISIILMLLPFSQSESIAYLNLSRAVSTFLVTLIFYFLFKIKSFRIYISRLFELVDKKSNTLMLIILVLLFTTFLITTCLHAYRFVFESFAATFFIFLSFVLLCYAIIKEYIKNKNTLEEQKSLLKIMHEYEYMLEKDRINRHEMLNNLLILKSYKNKSTKKYEEILNSIISDYQNKGHGSYSSLYNLPNGIKGIVYYKISNIVDKDIKFRSIISKDIYEYFDNMDEKLYYKICKILGILIDNAIEAAVLTEEKVIFIEIYKNKDLEILIENSFSNEIDFDSINKKGFSTKGKNRGLGLYIVNNIVKNCDNLILNQYISANHFVSVLKVKL